MKRVLFLAVILGLALVGPGQAGSIFLTGHDPDFHAHQGANALGARHINQAAIGYIMDPGFNTSVNAGATRFLFVESYISPPGATSLASWGSSTAATPPASTT
jgi:hypothetical protein